MSFETPIMIIGAGMSGLALGIQLVRQYGLRTFEIFEKTTQISGTWSVNSYPGCGCDVPSHFYSYSFAPNPNWSQKFAMQPEINQYFQDVAKKYELRQHIRFGIDVISAVWDDDEGIWTLTLQDVHTKSVSRRRCKILISAVGALSVPNKCDVPGVTDFKGPIFHTAAWDHSFDWKGKNVVVIGNGCSATQVVPAISNGPNAVKRVTQFARQAHWLAERPNPQYSRTFKWVMKWVPLAMRLYRAKLYWEKERDFGGFDVVSGSQIRSGWTKDATEYIKRNAPPQYLDFLVPKTEVGCKRRVNETDYLACLHRQNVELIYDDPITRINPTGVCTRSGRVIAVDAIVLAQGFETQKPLAPMTVIGKNGVSINDHWNEVSEGAPSSYFGTCLSGFPNFFIMMGPNTLSGHLSVIYTTECQVNFTLRLIKPVLQAVGAIRCAPTLRRNNMDIIEVTPDAEERDIKETQDKAKLLVWATGCSSWFIEPRTGRNTIMFPNWQYIFWLRSILIPRSHFSQRRSRNLSVGNSSSIWTFVIVSSLGACVAMGLVYFRAA